MFTFFAVALVLLASLLAVGVAGLYLRHQIRAVNPNRKGDPSTAHESLACDPFLPWFSFVLPEKALKVAGSVLLLVLVALAAAQGILGAYFARFHPTCTVTVSASDARDAALLADLPLLDEPCDITPYIDADTPRYIDLPISSLSCSDQYPTSEAVALTNIIKTANCNNTSGMKAQLAAALCVVATPSRGVVEVHSNFKIDPFSLRLETVR